MAGDKTTEGTHGVEGCKELWPSDDARNARERDGQSLGLGMQWREIGSPPEEAWC